ncbi:MAG TPA: DNA primase [Chthoniobacteraceae bacterium]|nr:DNA primase [Chthoniobacteraceae bacterium]
MPRIPDEIIQQIAAANDIVDVIGGYFPLKKVSGPNFRALCPFHREKTPSFNVNQARQAYHCFGCGANGTVFRFVMEYESTDFVSAARKLAERAGIRIEMTEFSAEEEGRSKLRRRLLALHQQAADWFHYNLLKTEGAQPARDYLKGRGFTSEVAKAWKIGYAPDAWDALSGWAVSQGFTREEIRQSGLVSSREEGGGDFYDRFRGRVMFPICNDQGEVIAFSGRVLDADAKAAKYVNSPETMLFTKGNVLFGLHKSKRPLIDKRVAIVLEGQIDLISAFEAGIQNVIAPQGTAFTEKQAHILKRYVEEVVLCFDSDTAGQKAADRSLPSLLGENLSVRVAALPAGDDPDSLIRKKGAEAFTALIDGAKDFFDYQIARAAAAPDFATPRGRMQFARRMAAWVSLITDSMLREAVSNKVATRLEISMQEFVKLLKRPQASQTREEQPKGAESAAPLQLDPVGANLVLVALTDAGARTWLLQQEWKELLSSEPEMDLLAKVLALDITPGDSAGLNSWLATLPGNEEAGIRRILERGVLPLSLPSRHDAVSIRPEETVGKSWHPLKTAQDAWCFLQQRQIKRRLDSINAILKAPETTQKEALELQKEILDLQRRLTDIARPFSPNPDQE